MKKFGLIALICLLLFQLMIFTEKVLSAEVEAENEANVVSYVMFSRKPIRSIKSQNEDIVKPTIMTTIQNKRDTVIMDIKSEGHTVIIVNLGKEEFVVNVNVNKYGVNISSKCKLFSFFQLDVPDSVTNIKEEKK